MRAIATHFAVNVDGRGLVAEDALGSVTRNRPLRNCIGAYEGTPPRTEQYF